MQLHEDYIDNISQDEIRQEEVKAEEKYEYRFIIELKDQSFYKYDFNEIVRRLDMVMRRQPEVDNFKVLSDVSHMSFRYGFNAGFSNISSAYQFVHAICIAISTSCKQFDNQCMFFYDNDEEFPYKSSATNPTMVIQLMDRFSQYIIKDAAQNSYTWLWNCLKQLTSRSVRKCQEFILKSINALQFMSKELGQSFSLINSLKDVNTFAVKQLSGVKLDISALMKFDVPEEVKWVIMTIGGNASIQGAYNHYPFEKAITDDYLRQITQDLWLHQPSVYAPKIFVSGDGKPDARKYVFCCYAGMINVRNNHPRAIFIVIETTYQVKLKKLPTQKDFFRTINVLLSGGLTNDVMKDVIYATRNAKKVNEDFIDNMSDDEIIATQQTGEPVHQKHGVSMMMEIWPYENTQNYQIHRRADIERRIERYIKHLPEITEYDIFYTGNPHFLTVMEPDLKPFFSEDDNIHTLEGFMICVTFDGEFKSVRRALEFILRVFDDIKDKWMKAWMTNKEFSKWTVVSKDWVKAMRTSREFMDLPNSGTQMMAYNSMTDILDMLIKNQTKVQDHMMNIIYDASGPIHKFSMDQVDRLTPGAHNNAYTVYLGSYLAKFLGDDETYFKEMKKFRFTKSVLCEFISDNRTKLYLGKFPWPNSINRKEIIDNGIWADFDVCRDGWASKVLAQSKDTLMVLSSDFRMKVQGNDSYLCFLVILNSFEEDDQLFFIPMVIQQKISGQRGIAAAVKNMSKTIKKLSGQDMGFDTALLKTIDALY